MKNNKRVTIDEAARILGKHQNTVRRMIERNELAATQDRPGGPWAVIVDGTLIPVNSKGEQSVNQHGEQTVTNEVAKYSELATRIVDLEVDLRIKDEKLAAKDELLAEKAHSLERGCRVLETSPYAKRLSSKTVLYACHGRSMRGAVGTRARGGTNLALHDSYVVTGPY